MHAEPRKRWRSRTGAQYHEGANGVWTRRTLRWAEWQRLRRGEACRPKPAVRAFVMSRRIAEMGEVATP